MEPSTLVDDHHFCTGKSGCCLARNANLHMADPSRTYLVPDHSGLLLYCVTFAGMVIVAATGVSGRLHSLYCTEHWNHWPIFWRLSIAAKSFCGLAFPRS